MRTRYLLPITIIFVLLAGGVLVDRSWFYVALIFLMLLTHMLGHGSHSNKTLHSNSHTEKKDEKEGHEGHGC